MNRIILFFLFSCVGCLTVKAQQGQADMTVFGFKLGAPFSVPECACKVVETRAGAIPGRPFSQFAKNKGYQYTELAPASGFCFKRKDLTKYTVKKKNELDSMPPVTNEAVEVVFSTKDAPAMCPLGKFDAIVKNGNLAAIIFTIWTADADKDLEILKNKYGTHVNIQNYKVQNGYGASVNYYQAIWGFPNLVVSLLSSQHRMLSDNFGQITIGLATPIKTEEDKRPL